MNVLILNADYRPHGVVDVRRAFSLVERGVVDVLAASGDLLTASARVPKPSVIRLRHYANVPARVPRPTNREILIRDNYTCAYCGRPAHTIDHVKPQHACRSEGVSAQRWDNCVAACARCNGRKGGKTLKESGMAFRPGFKPGVPRAGHLRPALARSLQAAPPEWAAFLGA